MADLYGDDMITFEHSPQDIRFVWPDNMDLKSFHDKQAPLVLDIVDRRVFGVHIIATIVFLKSVNVYDMFFIYKVNINVNCIGNSIRFPLFHIFHIFETKDVSTP